MLKMRLQRIGRKNNPSYRVLVVDSRQGPKSGKFIDQIGSYNPKDDHIQIDGEKAKAWIAKGVQLSDTVHNMLVGQGVIEGKKVNALPKKSPIVSETPEEEETKETPAAEGEKADETPEEKNTEDAAEETPAEEPAPEEKKEDSPEEKKEAESAEEKKGEPAAA